jgi:hypothetical protein
VTAAQRAPPKLAPAFKECKGAQLASAVGCCHHVCLSLQEGLIVMYKVVKLLAHVCCQQLVAAAQRAVVQLPVWHLL